MGFRFRCWSCGLDLVHEGDEMPPLEALSPQQAAAVGVPYTGDPAWILCDNLKNMSVYNFCSVCIRLTHINMVWEPDLEHLFWNGAQPLKRTDIPPNPKCSCGWEYKVPPDAHGSWRWIWINRATRIHRARQYRDDVDWADFDLFSQV